MVAITLALIHLLIFVVIVGGGIVTFHMYLGFRLRAINEQQMTARQIAQARIEAAAELETVTERALLTAQRRPT